VLIAPSDIAAIWHQVADGVAAARWRQPILMVT